MSTPISTPNSTTTSQILSDSKVVPTLNFRRKFAVALLKVGKSACHNEFFNTRAAKPEKVKTAAKAWRHSKVSSIVSNFFCPVERCEFSANVECFRCRRKFCRAHMVPCSDRVDCNMVCAGCHGDVVVCEHTDEHGRCNRLTQVDWWFQCASCWKPLCEDHFKGCRRCTDEYCVDCWKKFSAAGSLCRLGVRLTNEQMKIE